MPSSLGLPRSSPGEAPGNPRQVALRKEARFSGPTRRGWRCRGLRQLAVLIIRKPRLDNPYQTRDFSADARDEGGELFALIEQQAFAFDIDIDDLEAVDGSIQ
jgi:hypothetical protein